MSKLKAGLSKDLKMTLSAMVDDEAGDVGIRRVLTDSDTASMQVLWKRHHLLRSIMDERSGKPFAKAPDNFLNNIQSGISLASDRSVATLKNIDKNTNSAIEIRKFGRFLQFPSLRGALQPLALAASVALVAVLVMSFIWDGSFSSAGDASYATASDAASSRQLQVAPSGQTVTVSGSPSRLASERFVQHRLSAYTLQHASNSRAVSTRFVPFVKMASSSVWSGTVPASQQGVLRPASADGR